jgi:hypothetical protein
VAVALPNSGAAGWDGQSRRSIWCNYGFSVGLDSNCVVVYFECVADRARQRSRRASRRGMSNIQLRKFGARLRGFERVRVEGATVLLTRGRPTILEPETQLSFRLVDPVTVETGQAQQAYLPVRQDDYEGGRFERRDPRRVAGRYPVYPCGYDSPCYVYPGYFYPGYVGIYGGYYGRCGYRRW